MFDGYDSCSEDTSSSSSSEESEEEVAPLPSSLPIIKNNGQVYTYPDGKSGMGECPHFDPLHEGVLFEGVFSFDIFVRLVWLFYFIFRQCLAVEPRLVKNSQSSCLCWGYKQCHHAWSLLSTFKGLFEDTEPETPEFQIRSQNLSLPPYLLVGSKWNNSKSKGKIQLMTIPPVEGKVGKIVEF